MFINIKYNKYIDFFTRTPILRIIDICIRSRDGRGSND